jgi:hypothetical protein
LPRAAPSLVIVTRGRLFVSVIASPYPRHSDTRVGLFYVHRPEQATRSNSFYHPVYKRFTTPVSI